jgi:hypothetical protein
MASGVREETVAVNVNDMTGLARVDMLASAMNER